MKLRFPILCMVLTVLITGCVKETKVEIPGYNYMEKKIFLDVAAIRVVNQYRAKEKNLNNTMLPASIISDLEHWLRNRFIAAGNQGVAIIRILEAPVTEKGLSEVAHTHEIFTTGQPDQFGAGAHVVIEVQNVPEFAEGKAEVSLSRTISVESDVKMAFRRQIWAGFIQNFMNALDEQFVMNIETYLPGLIVPAIVVNQTAKAQLQQVEAQNQEVLGNSEEAEDDLDNEAIEE